MNKTSFTMMIEVMKRALEKQPKVSFNELRKRDDKITTTTEHLFLALKEHSVIAPKDLKFSPVKGKIDPNVVSDLEIEKASS